jgi:hypothetical protein
MADYPVAYDQRLEQADLIDLIELRAIEIGLTIHRGSLAKYQGCTHWHFKMPSKVGTLEMTFWPKKSQLWLSARSNRQGDWIPEKLETLRSLLVQKIE